MTGKILTVLACGLGAVALLCLVFLWKGIMVAPTKTVPVSDEVFTNDLTKKEQEDVPMLPSMKGEFVFEPANISFTLPEGWRSVPLSDAPALEGFSTSQFALAKESDGCFLVFYDQRIDTDVYAQTGFGERTFAGPLQFDNQWYAPQEALPEDFSFSFANAQRFPREIYTLGIHGSTPTFKIAPQLILFEQEGKVIPDTCIADMKPLTESWKPYFAGATLDSKSTGYIYAGYQPGGAGTGVAHIFFKSDTGNAPQVLSQAPAPRWRDMTFRADGTIEGVTERGTLSRFNVFSGATSNSPQLISSGVVLTHYRHATREWVLATADMACLDKGNCLSTLHVKNDSGLFTPVTGGKMQGPTRILGYIPEKKQVVLWSGFGDGGCSTQQLYIYDEAKKSMTKSAGYGGCAGDEETEPYVADKEKFDAIKEAAGIPRTSTLLRVEKGMLTTADEQLLREASAGMVFTEDYSL
jgi:hypothetical protein